MILRFISIAPFVFCPYIIRDGETGAENNSFLQTLYGFPICPANSGSGLYRFTAPLHPRFARFPGIQPTCETNPFACCQNKLTGKPASRRSDCVQKGEFRMPQKIRRFCTIRQFAAIFGARFVQFDGNAVPFSSIHRKSCRFFVNFGYCFFLQNRV
jgi:hypothetical protein